MRAQRGSAGPAAACDTDGQGGVDLQNVLGVDVARRQCGACGRPTITSEVWKAAGIDQREAWKAEGVRRYGGRGACVNCWTAASKAGELHELGGRVLHDRTNDAPTQAADMAERHRASLCSRCGIPAARMTKGLCNDCLLVTEDLKETDRWAS